MKHSWKKLVSLILLLTTVGAFNLTAFWAVKAAVGPPSPVLQSVAQGAATNTTTSLVPLQFTLPAMGTLDLGAASNLEAFLQAPIGVVPEPYVILSASGVPADLSNLQITGFVNATAFVCPGSPCKFVLQEGDFSFVFKAVSASGESSRDVYATIRVNLAAQGYIVVVQALSQFHVGEDACRQIWGPIDDTNPPWAVFPQFANELDTQKTLQYLVTMLIQHGQVDVNDCPGGAVTTNLGWPTGCGLDRARSTMISWQNQYDDNIWRAGNEIGIPPRILKTLLEIESQFWPGNQRFYMQEFGLGQINQLGLDPLLRSDSGLYQTICSAVFSTVCTAPYIRQPLAVQGMLRGALMNAFDATCPRCASGLDLTKAGQSIPLIARVLRADCQQTKNILQLEGYSATYEDYWKFTLLSYHSGVGCFQAAVVAVVKADETMDWAHIADHLNCALDGQQYVDGFWADLNSFDQYRITTVELAGTMYVPIATPTRTPEPLSQAQVVVIVYMDLNGDGIAEAQELLTGIGVNVTLQDGRVLSAVTSQGQASFDMTGYPANTVITVTLPGLYRSYSTTLPQQGVVPVMFVFQNPGLPQQLP